MSDETGPLESGSREVQYVVVNDSGNQLIGPPEVDSLRKARMWREELLDVHNVSDVHIIREDRTVVPPDADADLWGVADLAALHEALTAACAILDGEADELDARRPHPPQYAFLDDVSEGLRLRAERTREVLESELETEANSPGVLDRERYGGQGNPSPVSRFGILSRVENHLTAYLDLLREQGRAEATLQPLDRDVDRFREFKREVSRELHRLETDGGVPRENPERDTPTLPRNHCPDCEVKMDLTPQGPDGVVYECPDCHSIYRAVRASAPLARGRKIEDGMKWRAEPHLETDGGGSSEDLLERDGERVSGTITQIIPPGDHGGYAISGESRAVAAGKYILTLDCRERGGLLWWLGQLLEWTRDPTDTGEDVYHVLLDECPYSVGDGFSGVLKPLEMDFWTPVTREPEARTDGGEVQRTAEAVNVTIRSEFPVPPGTPEDEALEAARDTFSEELETDGLDVELEVETEGWSGPKTASLEHHPMGLLMEHPLPTGDDEARALWEVNEQLQRRYDEPPHPDTLHENHVITVAETDHWEAFRVDIYGFGLRLYFWCSWGDYGFWISTPEDDHTVLRDLFLAWAEADHWGES